MILHEQLILVHSFYESLHYHGNVPFGNERPGVCVMHQSANLTGPTFQNIAETPIQLRFGRDYL